MTWRARTAGPSHTSPPPVGGSQRLAAAPPHERASGGGGRVNFAPHGAVYLTVRAVRARTLKNEFGVGPSPRDDVIHDPDEVSPASALMQVPPPHSLVKSLCHTRMPQLLHFVTATTQHPTPQRIVAAENIGPLGGRKGYLLGSQVLVQCLQRPNV